MTEDARAALAAVESLDVLEDFLERHHAAAIPALIGACVMWAVDNGAADLIRSSLRNAIDLTDKVEAVRKRHAS